MELTKKWTVALTILALSLALSPGAWASPERTALSAPAGELMLAIWVPVVGISLDLGFIFDTIGVGLDPAGNDRKARTSSTMDLRDGIPATSAQP